MAVNDGERGATGGRRKPDPITIDLNATSVRVEPDGAKEAEAGPETPEPAAAAEASGQVGIKADVAAEPELQAEPAVAAEPAPDRSAETAAVEPSLAASEEARADELADTAPSPAPVAAETSSQSEPADAGSEPKSAAEPFEPVHELRPQPANVWPRTIAAVLLGGVVGIAGVHLLSAVGLTPGGSDITALNAKIAGLDQKLAADPVHSLAAVTKELEAEKTRVAGLNTEIERLKQLPQVPGASVSEIARILEPFSGRVAAAVMHMDDIEKRIAGEQAVVRGESKATAEAVTERVAKVEASVTQRLATVEAAATDSVDKAAKSVAGVDRLGNDFAGLDKRVSGDVAVARGELKELGTATTAKFASLDSAVTTLADGIKGNGADLAGLKAALDGVSGKLADLDKRISAEFAVIRGTTTDFAGQTQKQAAETGDQVAKLQARIASLDEMSHAIDGLGARIGAFDEVKKIVEANTARLGQVDEAKKAADGVAASLWVIDQRMAKLQAQLAEVDALKASLVAGTEKIGALDARMAPLEVGLSKFDDWAKAGLATRSEAVAAIAIASLKSAVDSGRPFAAELTAAKSVAAGLVDLSRLEPYAAKGLASETDLVAAYPKVARKALEAADGSAKTEGGVFGTLLAHATQSVKIRREGDTVGEGADARLARIEARLGSHDLAGALTEWLSLPEPVRLATGDWGAALQARVEGAKVMTSVSDEVLAKLNAATK
ncbi:MAG: hypothetical protein P4L98_15970 [Ancalomicrobiaceae bacterium]|nr:hypothetical protein [Ancalomicrobiaceae bacterium]